MGTSNEMKTYCHECGMKLLDEEHCYMHPDDEIKIVWVICMDCKEFIERGFMESGLDD